MRNINIFDLVNNSTNILVEVPRDIVPTSSCTDFVLLDEVQGLVLDQDLGLDPTGVDSTNGVLEESSSLPRIEGPVAMELPRIEEPNSLDLLRIEGPKALVSYGYFNTAF